LDVGFAYLSFGGGVLWAYSAGDVAFAEIFVTPAGTSKGCG
jgi:hypothetical protein